MNGTAADGGRGLHGSNETPQESSTRSPAGLDSVGSSGAVRE